MTGTPEKQEEGRPPRRLRRRILRILLLCLVVLVLLVAALPLVVSAGLGESILLSLCQGELAVPASVGKVSMDWTGGLVVEEMRLDQPPGFGAGPAVTVRRIDLDLGLGKLLSGRYKARVVVEGLQVKAVRNERGELNLARLARPRAAGGEKGPAQAPGGKAAGEAPPLLLEALLRRGRVTLVDRQRGLAGSLTLQANLYNDDYGRPLATDGRADMSLGGEGGGAGRLTWQGTLDPATADIRLEVKGTGIDLSVWRPLLQLDEEVESLEGRVDARIDLARRGGELTGGWQVKVVQPAARVAALGEDPLRLEEIDLEGGGRLAPGAEFPTLTDLTLACGPLAIRRLPPERAGELLAGGKGEAFRLALDLAALPDHPALRGGAMALDGTLALEAGVPAGKAAGGGAFTLAGRGITLRQGKLTAGPLTLDGRGSLADLGDPLGTLAGSLDLALASLESDYARVRDATIRLGLAEGRLDLVLEETKINGGRGQARVSIDLRGKELPYRADLALREFEVGRPLAPLLAYFLPFAVAPDDARLAGRIGLATTASGRLPLGDPAAILASLEAKGELACTELFFQGAPALQQLLAAFDARGGHRFEDLKSDFRIAGEKLIQEGIAIKHKGSRVQVKGSTTFAGDLDYTFDFGQLLEKHKDGRKLLAALGAKSLPVALQGTLADPKPVIKPLDLDELLDRGVEKAKEKAKEELDEAIKKGLEKLFGDK